ncbi:linear amide C-N hydrolase [Pyxidicoccus trucidator]|uniref:linear amide C-N hydrolase n=1 Tax=Pyxidicoccus trucidator TaxID=2709662 RepID=UPI001F079D8C|nr:linear amide C-N hydrolase [Pyxidicoccus trucidator]
MRRTQARPVGTRTSVPFQSQTLKLLPLHLPIHDASGNSIVVEFIDGKPNIYSNPVAVLTNDPPFPLQLENLGGYSNLSPWDARPVEMGGKSFAPSGHGSGLRGMPGGSCTPST